MSAFICSRQHIAALVKFARSVRVVGLHALTRETDATLCTCRAADILMQENVRSVDARYRETNETPTQFTFAEISEARDLTPAEALKCAHCYDYQSCETDDYQQTTAYALVQKIIAAAEKLGADRKSRAYDAAPWGLS
jgi:hypothetical protein